MYSSVEKERLNKRCRERSAEKRPGGEKEGNMRKSRRMTTRKMTD